MRIIRALFSVAKSAPKEISNYERAMFKADGYCKFGLLKDDLLSEHCPEVVEALRRLPEELVYTRIFRHNRAAVLSANHSILPEEEWTKIEEDRPYLQDLLAEVHAENQEKKNWEANNPL